WNEAMTQPPTTPAPMVVSDEVRKAAPIFACRNFRDNPLDRIVVEEELQKLTKENESFRKWLSSDLCPKHQTPDPLNCPACNNVKSLTSANETLTARVRELE